MKYELFNKWDISPYFEENIVGYKYKIVHAGDSSRVLKNEY